MAGPSRAWYAIAVLLLAAGIAGAILFGLRAAREADAPLQRFVSGEKVRVDLEAGEDRTIYQQVEGVEAPAEPSAPQVDVLPCSVVGPDEAPVKVEESSFLFLTHGEDRFVANLDFEAERAGPHSVSCLRGSNSTGPFAVAVGPRIGLLAYSSTFAAVGALVLGLVLGGFSAWLTAQLRRQSRQGPRSPAARCPRARDG